MGDRANVYIKNEGTQGVYLYTHWSGTELPATLQAALKKRWRWNDYQYLARIIFDEMTKDDHGEETGYGISAVVGDGEGRVLMLDCDVPGGKVKVKSRSTSWTFEEYCNLSESELKEVWT